MSPLVCEFSAPSNSMKTCLIHFSISQKTTVVQVTHACNSSTLEVETIMNLRPAEATQPNPVSKIPGLECGSLVVN